ncbi:hypothetical protein VTL71DRAFT_9518 [Oculimacula yallundae]|uniref:Uncharacterized protein n=1 Tax=Oculimacula yallundae TaxID=86028 RepID=A0ABR4BS38_9HELO
MKRKSSSPNQPPGKRRSTRLQRQHENVQPSATLDGSRSSLLSSGLLSSSTAVPGPNNPGLVSPLAALPAAQPVQDLSHSISYQTDPASPSASTRSVLAAGTTLESRYGLKMETE